MTGKELLFTTVSDGKHSNNAVDDWEGNIFIEATEYEFSHLDSRPHSLEEKGTTPLLYGQHDNMLSRSFDV